MPDDKKLLSQISETKQSLREEQSKFEAIFYGAESHMVIFQGPEMVIEMFNNKYQEIYPNRDLKGKKLFDVVPELVSTQFPDILKNVYESGNSFVSHEGRVRIMNHVTNILEEKYFDTTFSRISYGEGKPYRILATPREVTERVLSKKQFEENFKELEKERDLREKFVTALSHDLRTPLSIAKMAAQLLKTGTLDPIEVGAMSDKISQSVDRADRMIRNLLDANRIKAGIGIPLTLEDCRLDQIIVSVAEDLTEIYGPRFDTSKIQTEVTGQWDQLAIHRMIENLAMNAIKYGGHESKISFTLKTKKNIAEITVHNFGNHISNEDQAILFTQYNRTKSAILSGQTGWGIGLALVKGITESHRGTISVTSNENEGTTFLIKLPLKS